MKERFIVIFSLFLLSCTEVQKIEFAEINNVLNEPEDNIPPEACINNAVNYPTCDQCTTGWVYNNLNQSCERATTRSVIIDHTSTDINEIPTRYIELAKENFRIAYGHTSHGSQIISGLAPIASPLFAYNTNGSNTSNVLSIRDRYPSGDLGNPDRVTWETRTRDLLNESNNDRNMIMWSWCGQAETSDPADIDIYLNLMSILERDYPNTTFIYMTGHMNSSGNNTTINARNNQIRNHVLSSNNRILFDFADIESFDPDGNFYPNADDGCSWCESWCRNNPNDCVDLPSTCSHSHPFNCKRKAIAFWWMMAMLAGWDGISN